MPADTAPRIVAATLSDIDAIRMLVRAYPKWIPVIRREPRPMLADHDAAVREHRIDDYCEMGTGCWR